MNQKYIFKTIHKTCFKKYLFNYDYTDVFFRRSLFFCKYVRSTVDHNLIVFVFQKIDAFASNHISIQNYHENRYLFILQLVIDLLNDSYKSFQINVPIIHRRLVTHHLNRKHEQRMFVIINGIVSIMFLTLRIMQTNYSFINEYHSIRGH